VKKVIVGCALLVVAIVAAVLVGGAAVIGALIPPLPSQPASAAGQVAAGRPCTKPVETQGYKPGPGAFEPNHTGIDFVCVGDLTIVAVLSGTVVVADDGPCPNTLARSVVSSGCNVVVETTLGGQDLYLRYGHLASGSLDVLKGERVAAGVALGIEGESGYATGLHVHFEVDLGAPNTAYCTNPVPYLDPSIVRCPCHS
jgi:murein DD-endopeptidase MepM/ murein hydrolase activator NlpD